VVTKEVKMTEAQTQRAMENMDRLASGIAIGKDAALEVLASIVAPELREIIDAVQKQIGAGYSSVQYSHQEACRKAGRDMEDTFFFDLSTHTSGLRLKFNRLFEEAHPEYRVVQAPFYELRLERVNP